MPLGRYPPDGGVVVHNVGTAFAIGQGVQRGWALISRGLTFWSRASGAGIYGCGWERRLATPCAILGLTRHGSTGSPTARPSLDGPCQTRASPWSRSAPGSSADPGGSRALSGLPPLHPLRVLRPRLSGADLPVADPGRRGDAPAFGRLRLEARIECGLCLYVCPSRIPFRGSVS